MAAGSAVADQQVALGVEGWAVDLVEARCPRRADRDVRGPTWRTRDPDRRLPGLESARDGDDHATGGCEYDPHLRVAYRDRQQLVDGEFRNRES